MRLVVAAVLAAVSWPTIASADRRSFTRTYEYMSQTRGQTELELYTTQSQATFDGDSPESFELQLAIEHGITDRWDVSLFHVFEQETGSGTLADRGEPLHFAELELRTRYRFAERGELPVDTVAYLEATKVFGGSVYRAQARAVLARDLGRVTVAVNPTIEIVFGGDVSVPDVGAGWAAGMTFDLAPTLEVGAETWGSFDVDAPGEAGFSAGPSASWSPTQSLWIATTVGFGLNDNADRIDVRGVVGLLL